MVSLKQHRPAQICAWDETERACERWTRLPSQTVCGRWRAHRAEKKPQLPPWPDDRHKKHTVTRAVECDYSLSLSYPASNKNTFIYSWDTNSFQSSSHYLWRCTESHLKILHGSLERVSSRKRASLLSTHSGGRTVCLCSTLCKTIYHVFITKQWNG